MRTKHRLATALVGAMAVTAAVTGATTAAAGQDAAPRAAAAATTLKVMDWNVQGGTGADGVTDFSRIVDVIGRENPDIVTLQELHDNRAVGGQNQWQVLLDAFPQYDAHFAKSDTNALGGVAGNLILSKYAIEETLTYQLPQYPAGTTAVLRSLGGAKVDVGGTDLRVYTTHLSASLGTEATERRRRQADAVVDKLPASLMNTPMLFTGDLNIRPDDEIRSWIAGAGWIDTWTQLNANTGTAVITHPGDEDDARIDYVYATPALETTAARTVVTSASDHYPVVSTVTIRTPAVAREGAVLTSDGTAGSAHVATFTDASAKLRVCDNKADGWGVRAYVRATAGGTVVLTGNDPAYADGCGTFTAAAGRLSTAVARICLYQGTTEKNCREQTIT